MSEVKVVKETKPEEAAVKPFAGWEFGRPLFRGSMFHMNPFALMRRFTEDMDKYFTNADVATFPAGEFWAPAIEMKEEGGKFSVKAELPGLTKEDVKVTVNDNVLTLEGERRHEKEEKREGYFHSERSYGKFARSVRLPEGAKAGDTVAQFNNGMLEVSMPVAARALREVPVQEAKAKAA